MKKTCRDSSRVDEKKILALRRPNREAENVIPPNLQRQAEEALKQLRSFTAASTAPSEKFRKTVQVIEEALEKLCDTEQTRTPELQIRALSRITGALKEVPMGDGTSAQTPEESAVAGVLCHQLVIPFLLDCRVRYLHRGFTTLLRAIFRQTEDDLLRIEEAFMRSIQTLCIEGSSEPALLPTETDFSASEEFKTPVMTFLNNLDSLTSTLVPLVPSIFSKTFITVLPLLGDSLRWCVYRSTSTTRYREVEPDAAVEGITNAVLGEDLERIRFGVRVVASYVHRYMDYLFPLTLDVTPHLSRLLEPSMTMLCSYTFPKDVLNATGLLVASITTVRHCDDTLLFMLCSFICNTDNGTASKSTASTVSHYAALLAVIECLCAPSEQLHTHTAAIRNSMELLFAPLTTHGRFALLKGLLAHLSSPIRGSLETLSVLMRSIPDPLEDHGKSTKSILYDLILPFAQKYYRAVDLPETRFMAIQTIDCAVRYVSAVLDNLRVADDGRTTPQPVASLLTQVRSQCVVPQRLSRLLQVATQLTMEVWDDSTTQVSGALYDTFNILLSINNRITDFYREFPELTEKCIAADIALLDRSATVMSVLSIQGERRGKYHALLALMSSMTCEEFLGALQRYYRPGAVPQSAGVEESVELFCKSLLQNASNHKVASVAGDTMGKLVALMCPSTGKRKPEMEDEESLNGISRRRLLKRILSSVVLSMLQKGFVHSASNTTTATHIGHVSAHFIGPLLKQDKEYVHLLLESIFQVRDREEHELEEERVSQSIIEVLSRAKGVGIDVQTQLIQGSATMDVVLKSLQNYKFEQRIAALALCVSSSKKTERILPWQALVMEQFLALNVHLGGDSAARKTLVDTFQKWVRRMTDSVDTSPHKKQVNITANEMSYTRAVLLPHLKRLVDVLVNNIGWDVTFSRGLSVERKVTACACYNVLIKSFQKNALLQEMMRTDLHRPGVILPLISDLSDGWSQMRQSASALLQSLVSPGMSFTEIFPPNKNPQSEADAALKDILSAATFRGAEGAVQRYMLLVRWAAMELDQKRVPAYLDLLEQNMKRLNKICVEMKSLHGKALYDFVTQHPLHGLLSLCSELFVSYFQCAHSAEDTDVVLGMVNHLFHSCSAVITVCGALVGHEVVADGEVVDCRGHIYDKNNKESESTMRYVVNNTWLGIRVATTCVQRVVSLVDITTVDYAAVQQTSYDLVNALLLTKHNGVMRCVRSALKTIVEALVRCRASKFYHLPSQLLSFLLGPDGVASNDISRMLRRSQGLPHALLAVLEAEDDSVPPVLFPIAMRSLLAVCGSTEKDDAVGLSQRSNALNVLKFIFEDKMFGERVIADVEAAFTISTRGFEHPSWTIRNSSLMLFAAVLQRFVGEHPATGGTGVNTSLHDIAKRTPRGVAYAYHQLCKGMEGDSSSGNQDLTMLPLLQMLSMLSPDPPHLITTGTSGGNDAEAMIDVVFRCNASKNLMIRAAAAVALPCLVPPCNMATVLGRLPACLQKQSPTSNTIHGALLQLQHFHSSYVGTLRRKQRVVHSPYATPETAKTTVCATIEVILQSKEVLELCAVRCPTVCSCLLMLMADILSYGIPFLSEEQDIARLVTPLLRFGCKITYSVWSCPSQLFQWSNADHAGTVDATALHYTMAVAQRHHMDTETSNIVAKLGALPLIAAPFSPTNDQVHNFSACVAKHLHLYYSEGRLDLDELMDTVDTMKSTFQLDLVFRAIRGVAAATENSINLRSWHLVAQSDFMDFLADVTSARELEVPSPLQDLLLKALSRCIIKGTLDAAWCSSALRLLAAVADRCPTSSRNQQLIDALEFFALPQRPQSMRLATLAAVADLLPWLVKPFLTGAEPPTVGAGALMLTLFSFLVDDSHDVRERAAAVCCNALLGTSRSMIQEPFSCALSVVLVLRRLYKAGALRREEVCRRFHSFCAEPSEEEESGEAEVLFNKESDNLFVEETVLEFYEAIVFTEDLSTLTTKGKWRTLSLVQHCDTRQQLYPTISTE